MESNLKFIETWEVAQFKAQQGVEKLEVKQIPTQARCSLSMALKQALAVGK